MEIIWSLFPAGCNLNVLTRGKEAEGAGMEAWEPPRMGGWAKGGMGAWHASLQAGSLALAGAAGSGRTSLGGT